MLSTTAAAAGGANRRPGARLPLPGLRRDARHAVWHEYHDAGTGRPTGRLVGFLDWDFAAPGPALRDLAFVVFSWVPLIARDVAAAEGFTNFSDRPRRLRLLLDAYGHRGGIDTVLDAIKARITDHIEGLRRLAAAGDPPFVGWSSWA